MEAINWLFMGLKSLTIDFNNHKYGPLTLISLLLRHLFQAGGMDHIHAERGLKKLIQANARSMCPKSKAPLTALSTTIEA